MRKNNFLLVEKSFKQSPSHTNVDGKISLDSLKVGDGWRIDFMWRLKLIKNVFFCVICQFCFTKFQVGG
jgi:hypothetical protein